MIGSTCSFVAFLAQLSKVSHAKKADDDFVEEAS